MPYSHRELERAAYIAGDVLTAALYGTFDDLEGRIKDLEQRVEDIEENMVVKENE